MFDVTKNERDEKRNKMTEHMIYPKQTHKLYACSQCGYEKQQQTNHYGKCYSLGRYNVCPACPPYKKYSEFGGSTVWICKEEQP